MVGFTAAMLAHCGILGDNRDDDGNKHKTGGSVRDWLHRSWPRVLGQADDVTDALVLAPAEHPVTAEAAIAAKDDPHPGPSTRSDSGAQACLALAAEHIKRQETIVIIIAVEEPAFLLAMHRIVGGVEVEDQFLGRRFERRDEGLQQDLVDAPRPGPVGGVLETAQRRRAGQRAVTLRRRLQSEIMAKIRMVVDVLVAQRQPEYTLAQHGRETVLHLARLPGVDQTPHRRGRQTQYPIRLAQKQNPAIARDVAAAKISPHPSPAAGWKLDAQTGRTCPRQTLIIRYDSI